MKRYALIVGIGKYTALPELAKPRNDAQAMYNLLDKHGNFDEIHVLVDQQATCARLTKKLEYVLLEQGTKAEVLIYFSGHGFTAGASKYERQGYLAAVDCRVKGAGGAAVSAEQGVSFALLNGLIGDANLAGLAVMLDCCQSGYSIEETLINRKLSGFGEKGYLLSAACRGFESAWENEGEPCSAYTMALVAALALPNEAAQGEVTALAAHLAVCATLKGTGQEPIQFGYGSDFVVVDYRGQVAAAAGAAVSAVVSEECPYQGLEAFTPETEKFFFGRNGDVQRLLQKLNGSNFVPVLGPSGSGKSSVVRAGLVTRLEAQGWQVAVMKPGKQPFVILEAVLREFLEGVDCSSGEVEELLGFDSAQPPGCVQCPGAIEHEGRALSGVEGRLAQDDIKLWLIVDQFEEVFTLCEDKTVQRAFVESLLLKQSETSSLAVVITMRSDFVDDWLRAGLSPEVIRQDTVWLGPLVDEALKAAIVEPASKQGYGLEPALLRDLLRDVAKEENCLPFLEFALTELWARRDTERHLLTVTAYDEMGGLTGALNQQATVKYNRLRKEVEQPWAKKIFLQLVRVGRGEKDTRQRQTKAALLAMGGLDDKAHAQTRKIIACVIADLVKARLLVTDGGTREVLARRELMDGEKGEGEKGEGESTTEGSIALDAAESAGYVDLAHEALLEGWDLFVQWRQEDRDLRRLVQRMADEYEVWQKAKVDDSKDDNDYLLTGGLLAEVREQRERLGKRLAESRPALMKYFAESDRKDAETVAMLQRALADANVRAESLKVRDKLLNNPAQTVNATLAALALVGRSQQAFQGEVVCPAQDALHRAWFNIRERLKLEGRSSPVRAVAFSPSGDRIVSGSHDNTLRLWDVEGNAIGSPFEGHSGSVTAVAFSPSGDRIVSGSDDNTLRLWDVEGNAIGSPFEGHSGSVYAVAFSPSGDRIVSGSVDTTLRLWDLKGNAIGSPFEGDSLLVRAVAFSPSGDRIVSGSADNTLRLWDVEGNAIGSPFEGHSDWVNAVAFS
ncbi:MAG: caspase family protein, partial [Cyanobacteria bacterium P01_F01_bin.53]